MGKREPTLHTPRNVIYVCVRHKLSLSARFLRKRLDKSTYSRGVVLTDTRRRRSDQQ
jgi:hypothetical protein